MHKLMRAICGFRVALRPPSPVKTKAVVIVCVILTAWSRSSTAQYHGIGDEHMSFSLPPTWQPSHSNETKSHLLIELVHAGDDINNWKELVSIQNDSRESVAPSSPQAFFDDLKALREKTCPGITLWNVIQQDEYSILYEWQLTAPCTGAPSAAQAAEQHEIARVVYGKYNVFELRYAAKGLSLSSEERAKWISRLSSAKATIDVEIDQSIPFTADQATAALRVAMKSIGCDVTSATSTLVECKRPHPNMFLKGSPSGGEKVTAVLESQGNQTHIRISTGKGFYGALNKEDWSYTVFHEMMTNLQSPVPSSSPTAQGIQ